MAKNLVIVESPAKAKTIKKFLGSNYKIEASMGHVRDLPKSQLGVDVENDFEPKYITIRGKGELLATLRKEVKKANKIYLATDPDREGEAISWHLMHSLNLEGKKTYRISFNEITKNAVKNSIKNARDIDMDLVNSQQARRLLDRIVGYQISPLLWKKVKKGLSAGRVQSITLKLICDRENEILLFIPKEYWSLNVELSDIDSNESFISKFYGKVNEKIELENKEQVDQVINDIKDESYEIVEIRERKKTRKPPVPFITSTLQQEAYKKINFSTSKTMSVAQKLYEGIELEGRGVVGLITYLRTDSTRISDEAHGAAVEFLTERLGEDYVNKINVAPNKKGKVQDAHEAIRPTYIDITPEEAKKSLTRDQHKLYKLIWDRFAASRMTPAIYKIKSIKFGVKDYIFTSSLSVLEFDGFLKVYDIKDDNEDNQTISNITEESKIKLLDIIDNQHFTKPPARYTEASLVKKLEENGVGRPSTYSPTITTILKRGYVGKEDKQLFPTELGEVVNEIMVNYFDDIVNVNFTASIEEQLDLVEEGEVQWKDVLRKFYPDFKEEVEKAETEISKIEIKDEVSDVVCDLCGRNMVIKLGRYGKFLACPGFPECRNTKPLLEKVEGIDCPKCGSSILHKKTKKGRKYYGCENNPECDFMVWNMPTAHKCEKCQSIMLEKGKKLICYNEDCKHVMDNSETKE